MWLLFYFIETMKGAKDMNDIIQISSRSRRGSNGSKVSVKLSLLKIHDDPKETNRNGLHWKEEYVLNNLESIKGMPICADWASEDKDELLGHGFIGMRKDEKTGLEEPIFEGDTVGYIESASIQVVDIEGKPTKVLVGDGYIFKNRYSNLVSLLRQSVENNEKIETSIEIMGLEENENKIVYEEDNPTQEFRTPLNYEFSGIALLGIKSADDNAILLECASKNETNTFTDKEDKEIMTEQEIMLAVEKALDKTTELNEKITELNSQIEEKDVALAEINETKEAVEKTVAEKDATIEELNAKIATLTDEVNECKKKELCSALDEKLSTYTEDEKKVAEVEINEYKADPMNKSVDAIVSKICVGIVEAQKAEASKIIAEQNSAKEDVVDIFSEMCSVEDKAEEDVNIF